MEVVKQYAASRQKVSTPTITIPFLKIPNHAAPRTSEAMMQNNMYQ